MLSSIATYFTGRAAKAGAALVTSMLTTGGGTAAVDYVASGEPSLPLVAHLVIGLAGGIVNWAHVYWRPNR